MTVSPPGAPVMGAPAVSVCLKVLKKRGDFVAASKAKRFGTPGFHLQARKRPNENSAHIGIGFTCSKKVGNAVARNRAKRRLREIARLVLPNLGQPGWDYVLVGRKEVTGTLPLSEMVSDLERALKGIHT